MMIYFLPFEQGRHASQLQQSSKTYRGPLAELKTSGKISLS